MPILFSHGGGVPPPGDDVCCCCGEGYPPGAWLLLLRRGGYPPPLMEPLLLHRGTPCRHQKTNCCCCGVLHRFKKQLRATPGDILPSTLKTYLFGHWFNLKSVKKRASQKTNINKAPIGQTNLGDVWVFSCFFNVCYRIFGVILFQNG